MHFLRTVLTSSFVLTFCNVFLLLESNDPSKVTTPESNDRAPKAANYESNEGRYFREFTVLTLVWKGFVTVKDAKQNNLALIYFNYFSFKGRKKSTQVYC